MPGTDGSYEVSDDGRVRGLRKHGNGERILRPTANQHGYLRVRLSVNGNKLTRRVSRLVLEAFVGPAPDGMQAAHLDGVRDNNRLENLAWKTREENQADKLVHDTIPRGERQYFAKLTDAKVREIRARLSAGEVPKAICVDYGVAASRIYEIAKGTAWAHVA